MQEGAVAGGEHEAFVVPGGTGGEAITAADGRGAEIGRMAGRLVGDGVNRCLLLTDGLANVLEQPEFAQGLKLRGVLEVLQRSDFFEQLIPVLARSKWADEIMSETFSFGEGITGRVVQSGKILQLEPMPAVERRVVHMALLEHPKVRTQSVGVEPNRRIVVLPASKIEPKS